MSRASGHGMTELILGTAEFGPKPYGTAKKALSFDEIKAILDLAKARGIRTIDTAISYGLSKKVKGYINGNFSVIDKSRDEKELDDWNGCVHRLYHCKPDEPIRPYLDNSIYTDKQFVDGLMNDVTIFQVPHNLYGGVTGSIIATAVDLGVRVYVRSVFNRGGLLKYFSIEQCLEYALSVHPTGITVGVNSVKELEEILTAWESIGEK